MCFFKIKQTVRALREYLHRDVARIEVLKRGKGFTDKAKLTDLTISGKILMKVNYDEPAEPWPHGPSTRVITIPAELTDIKKAGRFSECVHLLELDGRETRDTLIFRGTPSTGGGEKNHE